MVLSEKSVAHSLPLPIVFVMLVMNDKGTLVASSTDSGSSCSSRSVFSSEKAFFFLRTFSLTSFLGQKQLGLARNKVMSDSPPPE